MWKGLLLLVVLLAILLPLSDGWKIKPKNVCSMSPRVGHCKARILRYYYNSRTGQCQRFYYGGCGGNGNNFRSLSQCQQKCSVCHMRHAVGHCRARIPRYYYNSRLKKCQKFYYGGCGGNGNNFRTFSQCQRKCMPKSCPVRGQVYSRCASPCRKTCGNYKWLRCRIRCRPGCTCPRGQVIDTKRNRCVPTKWCPAKIKPGRCPYVQRCWGRRKWPCASRCRTDSQCSGRKKCCRNSCGGRSCQNPVYHRRRHHIQITGVSGNATVV